MQLGASTSRAKVLATTAWKILYAGLAPFACSPASCYALRKCPAVEVLFANISVCVFCVAVGTPSSPVLSSVSCCLPPALPGSQVSILRAGVHATCTRLRHTSAATLLDRLAAYGTQTRHAMQHVSLQQLTCITWLHVCVLG
jgi:hypothetical protein